MPGYSSVIESSSNRLTLVVKKVKRARHGFLDSTTTGSAASSTPAASPGPTGPHHAVSEPGNPHSDEKSRINQAVGSTADQGVQNLAITPLELPTRRCRSPFSMNK